MLNTPKEIFSDIALATIFFILLVTIIIITAILYHNSKRIHKIEVSNFQSVLIKTQLEVQEQTMQTIGADLHDNIGQLLSLTSLTLNSIEPEDNIRVRQKVNAAIDLTTKSIKELRQLGKLLQGDQLVTLGLSEAIWHEITWIEKSGNFQVTYLQDGEFPAAGNMEKDLIIFRILQEIFNNIIKHAHATHIEIKLAYLDMSVHLQVIDNGTGFNAAGMTPEKKGMGLFNIQKRAQIVGGEVILKSAAGEGTAIDVFIPYP